MFSDYNKLNWKSLKQKTSGKISKYLEIHGSKKRNYNENQKKFQRNYNGNITSKFVGYSQAQQHTSLISFSTTLEYEAGRYQVQSQPHQLRETPIVRFKDRQTGLGGRGMRFSSK